MDIPGYDAWKTETPEDEHERIFGPCCPFCGAYDISRCEMLDDEDEDSVCAWEESEPEPDDLRDQRIEDRRMERENPRGWDD